MHARALYHHSYVRVQLYMICLGLVNQSIIIIAERNRYVWVYARMFASACPSKGRNHSAIPKEISWVVAFVRYSVCVFTRILHCLRARVSDYKIDSWARTR